MDNTKNVVGLIFFIIILLLFAVGGYFFMRYMLDDFEKKSSDKDVITEIKEIRIDDTKDYIYYENTSDILHEEHIEKQDVIINIKGFENINEQLANELASYDEEMLSIDEATIPEGEVCTNEANLYS